MATMKPFSAIRPSTQYVEQVASLPYDVVSVEEAKIIVKNNPYAFLQIDLPEVFLGEDQREDDETKYDYAKNHLEKLINQGVLQKDSDSCYYIYQLQNDKIRQRGIVGLASVAEYNKGIIKKHENTRADKEADRIKHVDYCNAHTGPIFLAYKQNAQLKQIISDYTINEKPIYDFTADDGVVHTVWKVVGDVGGCITDAFTQIENLYIADGHHRAAAAAAVGNKRKTPKSQYFLSVAFDEDELCIMDYNRMVKDLNGHKKDEFLDLISKDFTIEKVDAIYRPEKKGSFGMYHKQTWYHLSAREHIQSQDIVDALDVSILQNHLLNPILGIKEPRVDQRIEFVGGIRGLEYLEELADACDGVAFSMFPTTIQELMAIADASELMPPKSTWFEPKLRSGIFINELE